jgi:hypothetical protein
MSRLATLEADMGHVKDGVEDIKTTVCHIDTAIRGNDGAGLVARTTSLEKSRREQIYSQRRLWGVLASLIVGLILAAIVIFGR